MGTATYRGPADALELYTAAVELLADTELKGATRPYTSLHGHMFSFLDEEGVVSLRLADDDTQEFRADYESGDSQQYGSTMRGYSTVPEDLLARTDELAGWLTRSRAHVATLEPK